MQRLAEQEAVNGAFGPCHTWATSRSWSPIAAGGRWPPRFRWPGGRFDDHCRRGVAGALSWEDVSPEAMSPVAPATGIPPLEGVTGGLPLFAYPLEASAPVEYASGAVRWATGEHHPTLKVVSRASLRLAAGGVHELHWRLNAHELNVCLAGGGGSASSRPVGRARRLASCPAASRSSRMATRTTSRTPAQTSRTW